MTKTEKNKKVIKASQKLKALKITLENRMRKTETAFSEAKYLSTQLDQLKGK
ncbi:MAG: hypothetical protein AABY93_14955 [Bacteroidota bacterium]